MGTWAQTRLARVQGQWVTSREERAVSVQHTPPPALGFFKGQLDLKGSGRQNLKVPLSKKRHSTEKLGENWD